MSDEVFPRRRGMRFRPAGGLGHGANQHPGRDAHPGSRGAGHRPARARTRSMSTATPRNRACRKSRRGCRARVAAKDCRQAPPEGAPRRKSRRGTTSRQAQSPRTTPWTPLPGGGGRGLLSRCPCEEPPKGIVETIRPAASTLVRESPAPDQAAQESSTRKSSSTPRRSKPAWPCRGTVGSRNSLSNAPPRNASSAASSKAR